MEHLKAICAVLNVSLDEAIKGEPAEAKTAEEQAMLDAFRAATDQGRQVLLAMGTQVKAPGTN